MNRVRRTSRKYAEIMNRPDHIARVAAHEERKKFIQRKAQAMTMITNNPPKPSPKKTPKPSRIKAFTKVKNFFRRGQR